MKASKAGARTGHAASGVYAGVSMTIGRTPLVELRRIGYGVILCNARAMGEFGAVSVVSGHVRGETNTIPLQVEILYNEYNLSGAFAVASILTILALGTLLAKKLIELRIRTHKP